MLKPKTSTILHTSGALLCIVGRALEFTILCFYEYVAEKCEEQL